MQNSWKKWPECEMWQKRQKNQKKNQNSNIIIDYKNYKHTYIRSRIDTN